MDPTARADPPKREQTGICLVFLYETDGKLDYQVSICSVIPPATAISKTQDRADTSVWWKLPFSIFFIIYYVQSQINNKVCKPVMVLVFCPSDYCALHLYEVHENISNGFEDIERTHVYGGNGHFQYSKGNNSKSR